MTSLLIASVVVIVAAAVQSVTGFGFSITALPILTLLFGVREGIDVNLILSAVTNAGVAWQNRLDAVREVRRPLILGGLLGLIPGLLLFELAAERTLRVVIAVALVSGAVLLLAGARVRLTKSRTGSLIAGLFSGCLQGSISLGGPPVSLYLTGLGLTNAAYRSTMATFFVIPNAINLPAHLAGSPNLRRDLLTAASLLIALPIGNRLGCMAFPRLRQSWFKRIVLVLVIAAASTAAYQALNPSGSKLSGARMPVARQQLLKPRQQPVAAALRAATF